MSIPYGDRASLVDKKANADNIKWILYKRHKDNRSLEKSMESIRDLIRWLMFERTGTKHYTFELANDESPTSVTITASDQGDKDGPLICYVDASHKTMSTSLRLAVVLRPTKLKSSHPPGMIISDRFDASYHFEPTMHRINSHSAVFIMDINPGKKDANESLLSTTFNFTFVSVLKLLRRVGMIQKESMVVCATDLYDKDPADLNRQRGFAEAVGGPLDSHSATIADLFSRYPDRPIRLVGGRVHASEASFISYATDGDDNKLYKKRMELEEKKREEETKSTTKKVDARRAKWDTEIRNRTSDTSVRKKNKKNDTGSCAVM